MTNQVFVFDPTLNDERSSVRGIGRYLQILRENFPQWTFVNDRDVKQLDSDSVFINPFFNLLQPPLTLRRVAQKQIAVIHDLIPLKYPKHFPAGIRGIVNIALNKFALRNYDMIITDSEASKTDIIKILNINTNRIKVIYPCLPKEFNLGHKTLQIKKGISIDKISKGKYCLYVGDATWNKNLVNLARAIKIADISCIFVGSVFKSMKNNQEINHPWQKEFKKFVREIKSDKRFILAGFISDYELFNLYEQAYFNILPSRDEGFGFSYLESANFSCPSLLSGISVLREISAGSALYVNPTNPEEIAEKIKEISSDKILHKRLADAAKKRSGFFSSEKFMKDFLSVVED